jgi:hypothetical protein
VLINSHIGRLVLSSLCVGVLLRLVFGGVRFAGFSTISVRSIFRPSHTISFTIHTVSVRWKLHIGKLVYDPVHTSHN